MSVLQARWRKFAVDSSGKATASVVTIVSASLGSRRREKLTTDWSGEATITDVDADWTSRLSGVMGRATISGCELRLFVTTVVFGVVVVAPPAEDISACILEIRQLK